jgi:hypothetical protein
MRSTLTYIMSIFTFGIVIFLSLLISGCSIIHPSINDTSDDLIYARYTPMQCEVAPWDAWLSNSGIRFIRAPTEQEILTMFYNNEYNITVSQARIINTSEVVCEACNVCSKGYMIEVMVEYKNIQIMEDTGWKIYPNHE